MAKVTSKLQVTLPKAIAERFRIRPGDEIDWREAGSVIQVLPVRPAAHNGNERVETRLKLFDQATDRQRHRNSIARGGRGRAADRGWSREELHERGRTR